VVKLDEKGEVGKGVEVMAEVADEVETAEVEEVELGKQTQDKKEEVEEEELESQK
jgi:hypothetical protein